MNYTKLLDSFIDSYPEYKGLIRLKNSLCPCCGGDGTTTFGWHSDDPAVFTEDDFMEDPDLHENLVSGLYAKTCPECDGDRVVKVLDEDRTPAHVLEDWEEWCNEAAETEAIYRAERAMGA